MKFLKSALGFVGGNWQIVIALAAAAYIGLLHLQLAGEKLHTAKVETRLRETNAALVKLETDTRAKTELAHAKDAARNANEKAARTQVSMEKASVHRKELDDLRRRYDALLRLRAREAAAAASGSGNPAVPAIPCAAPGVDDPALEDGFLASEIALRLKALQEWVRAQQAVPDPSPSM